MRDQYKTSDKRLGWIQYGKHVTVVEFVEILAKALKLPYGSIQLYYNGRRFDTASNKKFVEYTKRHYQNHTNCKSKYDYRSKLFVHELLVSIMD